MQPMPQRWTLRYHPLFVSFSRSVSAPAISVALLWAPTGVGCCGGLVALCSVAVSLFGGLVVGADAIGGFVVGTGAVW